MIGLLIYLGIVVGLFLLAFFSNRRFGLLGLALAAGSVLASIWGYDAGLVSGVLGTPTNQTTEAISAAVLIMIPAVILMFHGASYKGMVGKVVGALLFAVLGLAFLITPLSQIITVNGDSAKLYTLFLNNVDTIIGIGLVLAVADLFLTKPHHDKHDKHHKH